MIGDFLMEIVKEIRFFFRWLIIIYMRLKGNYLNFRKIFLLNRIYYYMGFLVSGFGIDIRK